MVSLRKLRKKFRRNSMAHLHPSTKDADTINIQRMERILRESDNSVHAKVNVNLFAYHIRKVC